MVPPWTRTQTIKQICIFLITHLHSNRQEPLLLAELLSEQRGRNRAEGSCLWASPAPPALLLQLQRLPGSVAVRHCPLLPSGLPFSRLSSSPCHSRGPLDAGRWDAGSGSPAVEGNSMKLWSSSLSRQKTGWLAQLVATETSHTSASQKFYLFRKVLLGPYNGMLELTASVVWTYQLLGRLQGQKQQSLAAADKDLPRSHSSGLGNLLPLTFPPETVQSLHVSV